MSVISIVKVILTSFILAVGHKCLLHRLWEEDLVLLLGCGCRGGRDHSVRHHLEVLHHGDVAQLLGDRERCLSVVGDGVWRSIGVKKQIHDLRVSLLGSLKQKGE